MFFDSHAHYWDRRFGSEWEGGAAALLSHLFSEGQITGVVNVGTNADTSRLAAEQAAPYPSMYFAAGLHPEDCRDAADLSAEYRAIEELLVGSGGKGVALGEIGLDYHYEDGAPRERQIEVFCAQLELAQRMELPVIVHDREAHGDCFDTVCRYPAVRGVFHSYSGSAEMARDLCRRGWYISFSGTVTFKNAARVREAAAAVPRDRLLIETDCPYLAPHPHRGELNHSGLLPYTAAAIAALWDCTPEEVGRQTAENARRLFGIGR